MANATGSTTRVQMQRVGHALIPHGNLKTYNPATGVFSVLFDFQPSGDQLYTFTPTAESIDVYLDQYGQCWKLVR